MSSAHLAAGSNLRMSIFDVMGSSDFQQMLPAKSRASVARFVALIKSCGGSMCAERARYGMLFEEVIDEIDFKI